MLIRSLDLTRGEVGGATDARLQALHAHLERRGDEHADGVRAVAQEHRRAAADDDERVVGGVLFDDARGELDHALFRPVGQSFSGIRLRIRRGDDAEEPVDKAFDVLIARLNV